MPRGGYRPGGGRPKGSKTVGKISAADARALVSAAGESPLAYMLRIMNHPDVDPARRDRLAVAAAPYVHGRPGEKDRSRKADKAAAAQEAAQGKFAVPAAPKLVVNND